MKKSNIRITTKNAEETYALGQEFVEYLKKGDVVALYGELGSGKTVFVKGACKGLDIKQQVTSPSFMLMQQYTGKRIVYHFDFYRISSIQEIESMNAEDYFKDSGISFIEWPQIAEPFFPRSTFKIYFKRSFKNEKVLEGVRIIDFTVPGKRRITLK